MDRARITKAAAVLIAGLALSVDVIDPTPSGQVGGGYNPTDPCNGIVC